MSEVWVSVYEDVSKNLWICNNIMSLHEHTRAHMQNHTFQHANCMKDVDKMCLLSFLTVPVFCKCGSKTKKASKNLSERYCNLNSKRDLKPLKMFTCFNIKKMQYF